MSQIVGQDKPDINDLSHFGVKGMKWGQRKKADNFQISAARRRTARARGEIGRQISANRKLQKGSKERMAGEKKVARMKASLLNNPDREIASRMKTGEKWLLGSLGIVGTVSTGSLLPVAVGAGAIAVTAARSAVIAKNQQDRRKAKGK